ncbi:MAG: hypothetical protein SGJ27_05435 [Candidatus Melainabacteria bacterium]|nr:hypothetical protein [Candidatus Melainabacteria bacterium]
MPSYQLNLFADNFQFYLQDEDANGDLSNSWTPAAADNLLAIAPGAIGVGTVRNMTVPVTVEIREDRPEERELWDKVNECSIDIKSGKLVIAGSTDYLPEAQRITVSPGKYTAQIFYGNLGSVSEDGYDGEDHYKVILWPQDNR